MQRRIVSFLMALLFPLSALPCSAFFIPKSNEAYMGKSYDWHFGHGYVTVNKRNVKKDSLKLNSTDVGFDWVSKYGSITFNQYAHEFPLGGLNEAGLAVEVLWLASSRYPDASNKKSVNELQWIQYVLDTAGNVDELIEQAEKVRVSPVQASVHYLACDSSKKCAVIEYLEKKLVIHTNADTSRYDMSIPSITNSDYFASSDYAKQFKGFGGVRDIPRDGYGSLSRFVRASSMAKTAPMNKGLLSKDYPFEILDSVNGGEYSKFNIVYNLRDKKIFYRTRFDNTAIRSFSIEDFDFSCSEPTLTLNIENDLEGHSSQAFTPYSDRENLAVVRRSLPDMPDFVQQVIANYPKSTECLN